MPSFVYLAHLPVAFNIKTNVLNAVHLLHVNHAILQRCSQFMRSQGQLVITSFLRMRVIQGVNIGQMFGTFNSLCNLFSLSKKLHLLRIIVHNVINSGQGNKNIKCMPLVFRCLHNLISLLVLLMGLIILFAFFVNRAIKHMAKSDAQIAMSQGIHLHRLVIIHEGRV